jgi:hypothetical protein
MAARDHQEVTQGRAAQAADFRQWERHANVALPEDFKAFLSICDGLNLRWRVRLNADAALPVGSVTLNSLSALKPVPLPPSFGLPGGGWGSSALTDSDDELSAATPRDAPRAFEIEGTAVSRVCLVYPPPLPAAAAPDAGSSSQAAAAAPSVWFQDAGCSWHFVAPSFTAYFRLVVLHRGVLHWQYAFTPLGLDPTALQWLRVYAPERAGMAEARLHDAQGAGRPTGAHRVAMSGV